MVSISLKLLSAFFLTLPLCSGRALSSQNNTNIDNEWLTPNETLNYFFRGELDQFLPSNESESSGLMEESLSLEQLINGNTEIVGEEIIHPGISSVNDQTFDEAPGRGDLCQNGECRIKKNRETSLREHELMQQILKSLNFTSPPQIREEDKIPIDSPLVKEIERNDRDEKFRSYIENNHGETRSKKLISVAKKSPFVKSNVDGYFFFNLSSENRPQFNIKRATLKYYIEPRNITVSNVTIKYNVIRPRHFNRRHSMDIKTFNVSVDDIIRNQGWMSLSFNALIGHVQMWLEKPEKNLGIRFYSSNVPNAIATSNGKKPYVEIEFNKRSKRSVEDRLEYCPVNSNRNDCCLNNFTINFEDVGWDWIIYPQTYQANYCAGHCSRIQDEYSVYKSLVETQANRTNNKVVQKRCCVAKEYAALSLLYYDKQSNIVYSSIPDMRILRCGCA